MHDVHFTWKSFRVEHLWDFDVNKLFEMNMSLLQSLYQALKKKPTKKRATEGMHLQSSKFCGFHNLIEHLQSDQVNLGISAR